MRAGTHSSQHRMATHSLQHRTDRHLGAGDHHGRCIAAACMPLCLHCPRAAHHFISQTHAAAQQQTNDTSLASVELTALPLHSQTTKEVDHRAMHSFKALQRRPSRATESIHRVTHPSLRMLALGGKCPLPLVWQPTAEALAVPIGIFKPNPYHRLLLNPCMLTMAGTHAGTTTQREGCHLLDPRGLQSQQQCTGVALRRAPAGTLSPSPPLRCAPATDAFG